MDNSRFTIKYADKTQAQEIISLTHFVVGTSLKDVYSPAVLKWFYEYHSVEHLLDELNDSAIIIAVYDNNKLVGTGTYYSDEIKRLFILPEYQRAGIGKIIVGTLEDEAKKKKSYAMLYANPAAVGYYLSKGYKPYNIAAEEIEEGEMLSFCTMVKNFIEPEWHIRKANVSDAESILEGQKRAFYPVAKAHNHMDMPPMTETCEDIKEEIATSTVFAAELGGEIIGSVRGKQKDGECYISRLWILPEYQSLGIGHALMYAVEDAFSYLPKYTLFTGSKSPHTIEFYKERIYIEMHREPVKDYELIYMEKMNAKRFISEIP